MINLSNRSLVSGGRHLLRRVGYDDECEELKARRDILIGDQSPFFEEPFFWYGSHGILARTVSDS
jgi:hypothetical protein